MRSLSLFGALVLVSACSSGGSSGSGSGGTAGSAATAGSGGVGAAAGAAGSGASGGMAGVAGATGGAGGAAGSTSNPRVELDTSMGKMVFELDPVRMPTTTANFLAYVDAGFYDGTIVHRVIPNFVIQGGGYTSGLSPKATNAPIPLETSPEILHDYGVISMARTSDPNSATSQFFVVNAAAGSHSLDGNYAAFGKMTEGNATLDAISAVSTSSQQGFDDVPVSEVVINTAKRL